MEKEKEDVEEKERRRRVERGGEGKGGKLREDRSAVRGSRGREAKEH
jgi:hypothetical protein